MKFIEKSKGGYGMGLIIFLSVVTLVAVLTAVAGVIIYRHDHGRKETEQEIPPAVTISEEFGKKISKAREDYKAGKSVTCKTFEQSLDLLENSNRETNPNKINHLL